MAFNFTYINYKTFISRLGVKFATVRNPLKVTTLLSTVEDNLKIYF